MSLGYCIEIFRGFYSLVVRFDNLLKRVLKQHLLFFCVAAFDAFVDHSADAGVRPYIFGSLDHVDDGIDRQDDAHDSERCSLSGHQREGQEIAAHGDSSIADCRKDGNEEPQQHGGPREFYSTILHCKEGCDQNEGCTTVHVDGCADREHKSRHTLVCSKPCFRRLHGDGKRRCGTLGEKCHQHGGRHCLEDLERIKAACQQKERKDDEELDAVSAQDYRNILSERAHDDA